MPQFWLENPNVLLNKNYITEIWPQNSFDLAQKLNAITRIIILVSILGYYLTKSMYIPMSALVSIVAIVIIYKTKKIESVNEAFSNIKESQEISQVLEKEFTMPTKNNPVMNVMMNEYTDNPKRKQAAPSYNKEVLEKINKVAQNKNDKLYRNLGDNLTFEHSMRNFYSMPNTSIPNNQKDFALFCYGNMASCKDGDYLQCSKNNSRLR
jgi:hypothetical protein